MHGTRAQHRATPRGTTRWCASLAGLVAAGLMPLACGGGTPTQTRDATGSPAASQGQPVAVVAFGDGVTAGVGLLEAQSWPAQIQAHLDELGYNVTVVNAGLPGDTAGAAPARIDDVLQRDARILILAIGAEDVRRGVPAATIERNLAQIIEHARVRALSVLLVGVKAPADFGAEYAASVDRVFQGLAQRYRLVFVPDLLEGISGRRDLLQADGLTPNAEGARAIADRVWLALQPMVDNLGGDLE